MTEQKKWKELSINEARFWGRVVGDPTITTTGNGECAWIKLRTNVREMSANGQFIDSEQIVPLLVLDPKKVEVVKQWVKDGRELSVRCYYKTWQHEGATYHGLVVMQVDLGRTPYVARDEQPGGDVVPQGG